jgi:hypothetical protein
MDNKVDKMSVLLYHQKMPLENNTKSKKPC